MRRHSTAWALLAGVLLGALDARSAGAWGAEGHQTIGAIADTLLIGTNAEKAVREILGTEKLETAALWADCVKGVSDTAPYSYHLNARYPECDPFQQSAAGREEMEDYVRRNSTACHPESAGEACHRQYHYADVAIEHRTYDRADVGTSDHDVVSAIDAAIAKLKGHASRRHSVLTPGKRPCGCWRIWSATCTNRCTWARSIWMWTDTRRTPTPERFDPASTTRGGNLLMHGRRKLHAEWDEIPRSLNAPQFLAEGVAQAKRCP